MLAPYKMHPETHLEQICQYIPIKRTKHVGAASTKDLSVGMKGLVIFDSVTKRIATKKKRGWR